MYLSIFKIQTALATRTLAIPIVLACLACAARTAIAGPWDPNEIKLVPMKISDGLYALVSSTADKNNPAGIPEATTGGIVIGANGVLVIESMLNEGLANQVLRYAKELAGDKPIRYLVNTVYHGDHYYGNYLFPASTTIIMHTESKKYIDSKFEADRRFMTNLMGSDKGLDGVRPRAGDIMIDHDASIDLGGRVVELKVFGQGQTKGDLFVWLPQEKAMFTSNAVLAEQPALPWLLEGNHDLSLQALKKIKSFLPPDAIIIPGHGRPTTVAKSLDYLIGYLETLDREVHAAVEKGLTLEETVKAVAMEEYSGYKPYPWTHKQMNVPHAYKRIKGLE
jgi:glyoxylase-like metal-dependent hydrolase (beta-lactamase superfamily II)